MNDTDVHAARPGRIERTLIRWLMRASTIDAIERLSNGFRLIELMGPALEGVSWSPGQKVQIMIGGLRVARTYTPIFWDPAQGRTRLLTWSHGNGPGSDWLMHARVGDDCSFFGPRRSLDVGNVQGPLVLFGDETAFGLACALAASGMTRVRLMLEVRDPTECRTVLDHMSLAPELLVQRADDDGHLHAVEDEITPLAKDGATFILVGRATAIQRLNRTLRAEGVGFSRLRTKAYWAPGKAGLD